MLKPKGAIVAGLRGGSRPRDAALAVMLGLLVGATCGWNLSFGLLLAVAIGLNLPTRLFVAAALAGGAIAFGASEITHTAGVAVLDRAGLGRAVAALGDGPVVALLEWDNYLLVGGAALALAIGLPVAGLSAGMVAHRNRKSDAVGSPLLRPYGVPVALVTAAAVLAVPWWLGPRFASRELLRQFSQYNAAEVSATDVQLSLWSGRFTIRDLRIADPAHLERDRVRIGRVVGQLSPGLLIRGRLHVGLVSLEHVRADVARRELARGTDDLPEGAEAAQLDLAGPGSERKIDLDAYLQNWPTVRRDLAWLGWLAAAIERLADAESEDAASDVENVAARSDLGCRQPRVLIRRLSVSDLASTWRLGRKSLLELTELTSDPRSAKQPASLRLVVPQFAGELSVKFLLRNNKRRHAITCSAYELNLAQFTGGSSSSVGHGATTAVGEGWLDCRRLELPLQLEVQPHDLPMDGPGEFAGIGHEQWRQVASRLDRLRIDALLGGPWTAPTLTVDADRLMEQVKHQLRAAGAHDLVLALEEQLARPRGETGEVVQASAESEPASPGVCQLSDEDLVARAPAGRMPSVTVASRPNRADAGPVRYPSTATPDAQTAGGASLAAHEAPQDELPPVEHIASSQATPRYPAAVRPVALPGPVNLFVGSDPIEVPSAPAPDAASRGIDLSSPDAPPAWPGEAAAGDFGTAGDAPSQPRTVVRRSFLTRWSGVLRERFNRGSRVPEPEPIDELTPPIAPPPFDSAPAFDASSSGPSMDEPGMPSTAASQPWYKRMWR